eukprot:COSAG03_NODE_1230_length_4512_cov_5.281668_2_plen_127_part_00
MQLIYQTFLVYRTGDGGKVAKNQAAGGRCRLAGLPLPQSPKRPRRDSGDDGTLARLRAELGTVQPYPDLTIPADMPLHALQSELRVMQELRSAPSPPDMPHSRTDWRLGDHIDRLQRHIDSFDADL